MNKEQAARFYSENVERKIAKVAVATDVMLEELTIAFTSVDDSSPFYPHCERILSAIVAEQNKRNQAKTATKRETTMTGQAQAKLAELPEVTQQEVMDTLTCYDVCNVTRSNGNYTIRKANDDGSIDTVGEFGQYVTRDDAAQAMKHTTEEALVMLSDLENVDKCKEIARYHRGDQYTTTPNDQVVEETAKDIALYVSDGEFKGPQLHAKQRAWAKLLQRDGHIIDWEQVACHFLEQV